VFCPVNKKGKQKPTFSFLTYLFTAFNSFKQNRLSGLREQHVALGVTHILLAPTTVVWGSEMAFIKYSKLMAKVKAAYLPPNMHIPADELPHDTKQWQEIGEANPHIKFVRELNFIENPNDEIVGFIPISQFDKPKPPTSFFPTAKHILLKMISWWFPTQIRLTAIHYEELGEEWNKEELSIQLKSYIQRQREAGKLKGNEVFVVLNGIENPHQLFYIPEPNEEDEIYEHQEGVTKQKIILHSIYPTRGVSNPAFHFFFLILFQTFHFHSESQFREVIMFGRFERRRGDVVDEEILLTPQYQNEYKMEGNSQRPVMMEEFNGEPMCEIFSSFEKCVVANVRIVDPQNLEDR